jgi:iron complex outermembrane receptor protein
MMIGRTLIVAFGGAAVLAIGACRGSGRLSQPSPDHAEIGYGTQADRDVTGAISSLSESQVGTARPMALEDLLRGRISGLQIIQGPGGRVTFRIRGTQSMLYDQEPLIVIDGIPLRGGASALAGLMPEDVARVDVLKDLASTAIYGSRGAGGVILIRTRR